MSATPYRRVAGVLLPLFSMRSSASWGIGEFRDLVPFSAWMRDAGLTLLQLLPLNEMAAGQSSPYSALSSAALDPIFISLDDVAAFDTASGAAALPVDALNALDRARQSTQIDYAAVRAAKQAAFEMAWNVARGEIAANLSFTAFRDRESWWLDDYTLFRATAEDAGPDWTTWPQPLRDRSLLTGSEGVAEEGNDARAMLGERRLFYAWLQWIAAGQWEQARARAREHGVRVFGDLPFMVNAASADVWSRQHDFMLDTSVGTPPDAFSETGQDWSVPAYRWPEIAADGFEWLRMRARRAADLFDGFRIDHLVGFYRTFVRPSEGEPYFLPGDEHQQVEQGEQILRLFIESGAAITAEDLGTVPDYVRASLVRLNLPGYHILRWERRWHDEGQPLIPPSDWPANAVATSGTHDTESMADWWEHEYNASFTPAVRDGLLESLYRSPSNLLILPFQDLFGWRDRINTPATVGDGNWRWALPWPVDRLGAIPVASERAQWLRDLAGQTGRL